MNAFIRVAAHPSPLLSQLPNIPPPFTTLTIDGEEIETTPEHPFFVMLRGWVAAGDLRVGESVRLRDGSYAVVEAAETHYDPQVMYNVTVAEAHTYFVGDDGCTVHNAGCQGGSYKNVRNTNRGGEVHHMPADNISPLDRNDGPAIWMETDDHRQTASWGKSRSAVDYRRRQQELIDAGRFDDAIQMDIDDIQAKFGNKYDDAILEMIDYLPQIYDKLPSSCRR